MVLVNAMNTLSKVESFVNTGWPVVHVDHYMRAKLQVPR